MIKINSILICRTNYFIRTEYKKGDKFKIIEIIDNKMVKLLSPDHHNFFYFLINSKNNAMNIWNYFYKPNELRKIKLRKLKNGINI